MDAAENTDSLRDGRHIMSYPSGPKHAADQSTNALIEFSAGCTALLPRRRHAKRTTAMLPMDGAHVRVTDDEKESRR